MLRDRESKSESSAAAASAAATSANASASVQKASSAEAKRVVQTLKRASTASISIPIYVEGEKIKWSCPELALLDSSAATKLSKNKTVYASSSIKDQELIILDHETLIVTRIPIDVRSLIKRDYNSQIFHLEEISSNEIAICFPDNILIFDFKVNKIIKNHQIGDAIDKSWGAVASRFYFSPDKQKMIFLGGEGVANVYFYNLLTQQYTRIRTNASYVYSGTFFSNNGFAIAYHLDGRDYVEFHSFPLLQNNSCSLVYGLNLNPRNRNSIFGEEAQLAISGDGKYLAVLGTYSAQIYQVPISKISNQLVAENSSLKLIFHLDIHEHRFQSAIYNLRCTPEGKFVFATRNGVFSVTLTHNEKTNQAVCNVQQLSNHEENVLTYKEIIEFSTHRGPFVHTVDDKRIAELPKHTITQLHDMRELNETLNAALPTLPIALMPIITSYTMYEPRMFRMNLLAEDMDFRRQLLLEESSRMQKSKRTAPEFKQAERDYRQVGNELFVLQRLQVNLQTMTAEKAVDETRRSFPDIPVTKAITNLFCLFKTEDAKANHAHQQSTVVATTQPAGKTKRNDCVIVNKKTR